MFDPFSVSPVQIDEVSKHFSIQIVALGQLLVAKGLITEEELVASIINATAKVDQEWEKRISEMREEFQREHPASAFFAKVFEGGK